MSLYELKDIVHDYDGQPVLTIDEWTVSVDAVTGVVGPNGSGKSTLLSLLGFVAKPARGEIRYQGRRAETFADSVRGKVALLPQDAYLLKRSVYNNIAYGLRFKKHAGVDNVRLRVHEAMEMVGLEPEAFARRPWFALSGGEARRVALAARLALQPEVLLMDEPTASVDATSARMIKAAALHARQQWGTTLIATSHDANWLADIADQLLHLFRGRILGSGFQTLIFGPWQTNGDGLLTKALQADQVFEAHGHPSDMNTAVAAIAADRMELYLDPQRIPAPQRGLKGILLHLNYEQSTGRVGAAVQVGDAMLNVYLPKSQASHSSFAPGQQAWVAYDPRSIEWY